MAKFGTVITLKDVLAKVNGEDVLLHYFGITLPHKPINSPLRDDKKPSFGFYIKGDMVNYRDFANGDGGTIFTLLSKMWGIPIHDVYKKVYKEVKHQGTLSKRTIKVTNTKSCLLKQPFILQSKKREWNSYDIDYWKEYGITTKWLEYANVYPISHIGYNNADGSKNVFKADRLAYAYIENKDNIITQKIYQPLSKTRKWLNSHNSSVISLWRQVMSLANKDIVVICSSVKDALTLWANTGIPAIAPQGEGYKISESAQKALRENFRLIYIMYDNDPPGIKDAEKLSEETGFEHIILPEFPMGKDLADYRKYLMSSKEFQKRIYKLLNYD